MTTNTEGAALDYEELRDVPGHEGRYAITRDGRIWSYEKRKAPGKWLSPAIDAHGYRLVRFMQNDVEKMLRVHRLVMLTFVGPSSLTVNHKNGIKTDNRLENLEYLTHGDNTRHAIRTGLWTHIRKNTGDAA